MDNFVDVSDISVSPSTSLKEAMRIIDDSGSGIIFILDEDGKLLGTATDGDIRRAILSGHDLSTDVVNIMNDDPVVILESWTNEDVFREISIEEIQRKAGKHGNLCVPVIDKNGSVTDLAYISSEGKIIDNIDKKENSHVKKILIIGGAGYIGSVLCRKLLNQGYSVRVLDNLMYGDQGIVDLYDNDNFEFINGDMRSIENIVEAIVDVDAVIHLGALVGDPASNINSQKTLEINYHSTKLIANICKYHQINRFIFASTCSVYGQSQEPNKLLSEEDSLNPVSLYAKTKMQSEKAILDMADENFSPTIFRMATIYGLSPRMRFDLVINILTAKAYKEQTIPIFGGEQYRPNVHVSDAAQAYIDCLEAPIQDVSSEIFNVGSNDQNYQIEDIGYIISNCFPNAEIDFQRDKEDERSYQVDFSKIKKVLDYETEYTIKKGVKEIKESFENNNFDDWTKDKYNNYRTLEEKMET